MTRSGSPDPTSAGWMDQAACHDQPPEVFTDPDGPDDINRALEVCAACPVRRACLHTALSHPPDADVGIWGGTTQPIRRRIRAGDLTVDDVLRPALTIVTDPYGDFTDPTGRVTIFALHGQPPYMLMIDRRPIQRTHTVEQAARTAWDLLYGQRRATPQARTRA